MAGFWVFSSKDNLPQEGEKVFCKKAHFIGYNSIIPTGI